jgi:hypothetical protein
MSVSVLGGNIDSEQSIMQNTVVADGKWRYMAGDRVVAEASAPPAMDASVITSWCDAVRSRINAAHVIERKPRDDRGLADNDGAGDSSVSSVPSSQSPALPEAAGPGSFDEDPEGYALERMKELSDRQTALEEELQSVIKQRRKWDAIAAAVQQTEED